MRPGIAHEYARFYNKVTLLVWYHTSALMIGYHRISGHLKTLEGCVWMVMWVEKYFNYVTSCVKSKICACLIIYIFHEYIVFRALIFKSFFSFMRMSERHQKKKKPGHVNCKLPVFLNGHFGPRECTVFVSEMLIFCYLKILVMIQMFWDELELKFAAIVDCIQERNTITNYLGSGYNHTVFISNLLIASVNVYRLF